jgi:hypothetical protein
MQEVRVRGRLWLDVVMHRGEEPTLHTDSQEEGQSEDAGEDQHLSPISIHLRKG